MILVFLSLAHCKQEIAEEVSPKKTAGNLKAVSQDVFVRITVENGRVKFANDQDFNLYFQEAHSRGIEYAEGYFANLADFFSLKEKNQTAELALADEAEDLFCRPNRETGEDECTNMNPPTTSEEGAEGESTLVEDEFVYLFLNQNAEFMISDKIVKITPRYTYIYASDTTVVFDENTDNFTNQTLSQKSVSDEAFFQVRGKLWAFKIQTEIQTIEEDKSEPNTKLLGFSCGKYSIKRELEYRTVRPKRKLKGKLFSQNLGVVASAGMLSKNLKRRLGLWWQEKAETIKLNWMNVKYQVKDPITGTVTEITKEDRSITESNKSKIVRPIDFNTAIFGCILDPATGRCKPKIKFSYCIKIKAGSTTYHFAKKAGKQGEFTQVVQ